MTALRLGGIVVSLVACGVPLHRPRQLDVLVVPSVGDGPATNFAEQIHKGVVARLLDRLLRPPDGRGANDIHAGVVPGRLVVPDLCPVDDEPSSYDGRLALPAFAPSMQPPAPPLEWPLSPPYARTGAGYDLVEVLTHAVYYAPGNKRRCGMAQYLEALALALDGRNGAFVRPDSMLAIVLLGDIEDCSTSDPTVWGPARWRDQYRSPSVRCYDSVSLLRPISRYVDVLERSHDSGRIFVLVVANPSPPAFATERPTFVTNLCDPGGSGAPAVRLSAFVAALNERSNPAIEARVVEACPMLNPYRAEALVPVDAAADRILEVMDR